MFWHICSIHMFLKEIKFLCIYYVSYLGKTINFYINVQYSIPGLRIRIHFIRIRIQLQQFRLNKDPDPMRIRIQSGSRALRTKNWEKNYCWKKFNFFGSKTTIYLSLGLHKERPSYRRSLQLSKEAIQHFKTWTFQEKFYFCGSFLPSWIRIPSTDPDPLTRLNPDPIRIRIRIRNPVSYGTTQIHSVSSF